jgi:hypothetical protein
LCTSKTTLLATVVTSFVLGGVSARHGNRNSSGTLAKIDIIDKFHRNAICGTTGIVTCQQTWRSSSKRTVTPFNVDTPANRLVAVLAVSDTVEAIVFPVFIDCLLVSVVTIAESSTTHCCAEPVLFNPHLHAICV